MVVLTYKKIHTTTRGSFAAAEMHTAPQTNPITFGTRGLFSHSFHSFRSAYFVMEEISTPN